MSDKKISQLTALTGANSATDDQLAIVDTNVAETKKISVAEMFKAVPSGTAADPAIARQGDQNTGIFFPAEDVIAFTEGGVEAGRFDASGNLLVGTTTNTNTSKVVSGGTISETVSAVQYLIASQFDVGTAPNQIPLNQYLGTMAYLDATNTSFSNVGTNVAEQNLAVNKMTTVTISADTTLTTTVPPVGSNAFVVVITSGATSRTVTFGTGFKSTGTLATGTNADRRFVFEFISDGTNMLEVSRTAAITY
jgi:hypothetical protein